MTSLNELHDDIINKVFYFVPSVRQLVQVGLTSGRFNCLVISHMKLLKTVDLREANGSECKQATQLCNFIKLNCSRRLTEIYYHADQVCDLDQLSLAHPQLFPRNMRHIRDGLNRILEQDNPCDSTIKRCRNASAIYEKLYRKMCPSMRFSPHVKIGLQDKLKCHRYSIEAFHEYVMEHEDKELFLEDMKNVERLTVLGFHDSGFVRTECIIPLTSMFRGLKELVLEITAKMYKAEAEELRNALDKLEVKVSLKIPSHRLPEESRPMIGKYVSQQYINSGDISGLANLEALVVDFSRTTSNIYLSDVPESLRSLHVTDMSWFESDKITDFIETYGVQLKQLYLSGYVYAEKKDLAGECMKILLAAIADKCVNLNVLHINYNVAPSIYREFLIQHTNKIGRELTDLDISHAYLSDAVIDTITKYCPKMKKLYLEFSEFDSRDTEVAYEKLSSLSKLEDVTLRLRD